MKLKFWIGTIALSLMGLVHAQEQPTGAPTALEQGTFTRGMPRHVTPAAGPRVAHGANAFLTADFIWWKATQDGLRYALGNVLTSSTSTLSGRGKVKTPDFSWDPGFKVGLGVNLPYDGWDIYLQYTWLQSNGNKSRMRDAAGNIQQGILMGSLNGQGSGFAELTEAFSRWDFHLNVLDVELGRSYYLSRYVILRPFGGLKWTWQDQDWAVDYSANELTLQGSPSNPGFVHMRQDMDLWGVGVRTGLNSQWNLAEHWSIFANGAVAAVWTDYDVDRIDTARLNTQTTATTILKNGADDYYVRGVLEFQLGIRAEWWFSDEDYHFSIAAAYEQQVWLSQGNYIYLIDYNGGGDLSLHGLTVKFRFDF